MAPFSYRAIDETGQACAGRLDAASAVDLERRLRRLGLELVTCKPATGATVARARRVRRADLAGLCLCLSQLNRAGVGMVESLADLRDTLDNPCLRQVVAALADDIGGGLRLSEAMARHDTVFDPVFVAIVSAGEQSGQITHVLDQLAENLKWQDELAAHAGRALIYPSLVLAVVVAVTVVLMVVLVPQLATTLKSLDPKLPPETEFLIAASSLAVQWWPVVLGLPAALGAAILAAARASEPLRQRLDALSLRLPVLGQIRLKIILARFATVFALLYRSGISVLDGLRICESTLGSRTMADALRGVRHAISEGQAISDAFAATGRFPPLVLRMLRVGESTGGLDAALLNVAYFYTRDAREGIARLQALSGPATTIVLGALIAGILYAVFLPLYGMVGKVPL